MANVLFRLLVVVAIIKGPFLVVLGGSSVPKWKQWNDDDLVASYSFHDYVHEFDKVYSSKSEYKYRETIFLQNVERIMAHNRQTKGSHRYKMGINQFTDRNHSKELPRGYDKSNHVAWRQNVGITGASISSRKPVLTWDHESLVSLPKSVDWRRYNKTFVTTPVKNQGQCGSCWAFASISVLESHIALQTDALFVLSTQELVSCSSNPNHCGGTGGCGGSTGEIAFDFVSKHGIVDEWTFSYQSYKGETINCTLAPKLTAASKDDPLRVTSDASGTSHSTNSGYRNKTRPTDSTFQGAVASITGFSNLQSNEYQALLTAVATKGPVLVSVSANDWYLYSSGVFDDDDSVTRDIDHSVVVEGYGTDETTGDDYWLVRNSWGPLWGENGYIRLKRVDPAKLDDPDEDCRMDVTPSDGSGCTIDDNGNEVVPNPVKVCGTCGILFDGVIPVGGKLIESSSSLT